MTNSIVHQYLELVIEKLVENMENLYLQTFSNQDIRELLVCNIAIA